MDGTEGSGSKQPITPEEIAHRRAVAVQALRSIPSGEYIAKSAAEALAAALVVSPPIALFYAADGVFNARYPRVAMGQQPPPIPQTFPGLIAAGLRYSFGCTARTVLFIAGSHGLGTALREQFKTGYRYEESPKDNPMYFASGFIAGSGMATFLTADWAAAMGGVRRGGYVVFGGLVGALLPDLMLRAGPMVRQKLLAWKEGSMQ